MNKYNVETNKGVLSFDNVKHIEVNDVFVTLRGQCDEPLLIIPAKEVIYIERAKESVSQCTDERACGACYSQQGECENVK